VRLLFLACLVLAGCDLGPLPPRDVRGPRANLPAVPKPLGRIVVAEHAGRGGHLLFVDESGRRLGSLTEPPAGDTFDVTPAWSPDGKSVAFSSSRDGGRGRGAASLWIVAADGTSPPRQLTTPPEGIDFQPAFAPDGRSLVYTAARAGNHAVWILSLGGGDARLLAADAVRPAWSHRGDLIAYTRQAGPRDPPEVWLVAPDGSGAHKLTDGAGAAFAPDDRQIAFTAKGEGRADADLWLIGADGDGRRRVVDDGIGDEQSPSFSSDGRFLFAESFVRDGDGKALFPSIVYVDLREPKPRLRALIDPSPGGWTSHAIAPVPLDADVLDRGPAYAEALTKALVAVPPEPR
jgi:Tol biopolymer transport system component